MPADPDDTTIIDVPAEVLTAIVDASEHVARQVQAAMVPVVTRAGRDEWIKGYTTGVREPRPVTPARVLAVLDVLGWPDDREEPAHVEPDGIDVMPPRWYWDLVVEAIEAADAAAVGGGA